jgi:hypothetical protein
LLFVFRDGWLTLTRTTPADVGVAERSIYANGWWQGTVSVDWHNALSVLDDMWFLNPFYLAFASKPRVFAFGSRVVQGRGGAAQGLLDFQIPASTNAPVQPAKAPVAPPPTLLDELLARIAAIGEQNSGQPPTKISELAERYERDAELVRLLKHARGGQCQVCRRAKESCHQKRSKVVTHRKAGVKR